MHPIIITMLTMLYCFSVAQLFAMETEPKPLIQFPNEVIYNILFQVREYRYLPDNPAHNCQVLKELCRLKKVNRTWHEIVNEFLCTDFVSAKNINTLKVCIGSVEPFDTDLIEPFCYVEKGSKTFSIYKSTNGSLHLAQLTGFFDQEEILHTLSDQYTETISSLRSTEINNKQCIISIARDNNVEVFDIQEQNNRLRNITPFIPVLYKKTGCQIPLFNGYGQSFLIVEMSNQKKPVVQAIQIWDFIPYPEKHIPEHIILWCLIQNAAYNNTTIFLPSYLKTAYRNLDEQTKEKVEDYIDDSLITNLKQLFRS